MSTALAVIPAVHCTCGELMSDHQRHSTGRGRPGRCLKEGCTCVRWSPPKSVGSKELKRLSNQRSREKKKIAKSNRRTKVLYKAPPQLVIPSLIDHSSNDLRRLVLKLGIQSLRAELDRIEKEI